jgi:hypothetical protein
MTLKNCPWPFSGYTYTCASLTGEGLVLLPVDGYLLLALKKFPGQFSFQKSFPSLFPIVFWRKSKALNGVFRD